MRRFVRSLIDSIFPPSCAGCGTRGTALCNICFAKLSPAKKSEFSTIHALYDYGDPVVRRIIHDCKYRGRSAAFELLAQRSVPAAFELISDQLMSEAMHPDYCFVPIPLERAHRFRGFNQSALIASIFSSGNTSTIAHLLRYTRHTIPQVHVRSKTARIKNRFGAFTTSGPIDSATLYIVVDDVTTTGATLIDAMRALREAGATNVCALALAHGYAPKK
jgi:predicted amidophosphoribosyltransferase